MTTDDGTRGEIDTMIAGQDHEHNLAYLNRSVPVDLSRDGSHLLFVEYTSGVNYAACWRKTDGSPTVVLSEGEPESLSADGQWALTMTHTPCRLLLVPTGTGEAVHVPDAGLMYQGGAQWFPDSKTIVFAANENGKGTRLWTQHMFPPDSPHAFTGEGMSISGRSVSPDSKWVAATGAGGKLALYPIDGGAPQPLPAVDSSDRFIQWSQDGSTLYLVAGDRLPARVYKLNWKTGTKQPWREYGPPDATGVFYVGPVLLTPDGASAVYGLSRYLYSLQLLDGAK
jgi:WD40-like Beta Propeller Repeat